ncbi:AraC family transcriptional regulator [Pseudoduganella lutea]|uniref:AraC family transcriptional regulator n=1 Tax=Pseudoduganella lutea TaxID=321985 RepID=A0A4P6KSX3_9BURK|nr:AraC family transcriptional regulator [Pseudoduganella lutea]QBE61796.1 AraC family transcriptional regulator [Pseudoduganella lutea]
MAFHDKALAALYSKPLFRSDTRAEAHDLVASEFAEHTLHWRAGTPDAAMHKSALDDISVYMLRYGPEVEVRAHPFDDFVLVHTSLHGGMEIDCDGRKLWIREGRSAVLAPRKNVQLRWSPRNRQMIVKVPRRLLVAAANNAGIGTVAPEPGFLLPPALDEQWKLLVQTTLASADQASPRRQWTSHLEQTIAAFIVLHEPAQEGATAPAIAPGHCADGNAGRGAIDALVGYIDQHLGGPISLQDLTLATGLGIRTVNALCQRHFGMTPMEVVRNRRLDAVHSRLRVDPHASVTETAMNFGFGHLGRFSAYYEARFQELPRQTQRACRRN